MKIVIDSAIPYTQGVLEPFAEVLYSPNITAEEVRNAQAIITRTRTRCNETLLSGSSVKIVASATIGFDHIDTLFCTNNNIAIERAAGCNSRAVLQWFAAALNHFCSKELRDPSSLTIGVVGVGSVGSLVSQYAKLWGAKVIECDPPRELREKYNNNTKEGESNNIKPFTSTPLEELLTQVDILTLHTPLDQTTHHLIGAKALASTKPNCLIINTSRGEVIDSEALLNSQRSYMLDVWENEPNLNPDLLAKALLATPHIAGYSIQGKACATAMTIRAIANHFNLPLKEWHPATAPSSPNPITWQELRSTINNYFNIEELSKSLKKSPKEFEQMRNSYSYRTEYF